MVAVYFDPRFAPDLRSGAKRITMRKPGRGVPVGTTIHGRIGERFQSGGTELAFARPCILRATVFIDERGLLRALNVHAEPVRGASLAALVMAAERGAYDAGAHADKIAALCGFSTWEDLHAFHLLSEAKPVTGKPIERDLFAWGVA